MDTIQAAAEALRNGQPVLLYDADGREEETDMVIPSSAATPELLRLMRQDAGGLICTAIAPEHHAKLDLPYLADMVAAMADQHPVLKGLMANDIKYDPSKSTFSLTINHRTTYTGIPDNDRSTTIRALAQLLDALDGLEPAAAQSEFGATFRAPGHCILLNGSPGGLETRQGHTELSIELARLAGLTPSTTICEMLGNDGKALPRVEAEAYAKKAGLVFLTGQDVVEAWKQAQAVPVPTSA